MEIYMIRCLCVACLGLTPIPLQHTYLRLFLCASIFTPSRTKPHQQNDTQRFSCASPPQPNQNHSYHIDVDALPIVAVLDPRTGGKVSQWVRPYLSIPVRLIPFGVGWMTMVDWLNEPLSSIHPSTSTYVHVPRSVH